MGFHEVGDEIEWRDTDGDGIEVWRPGKVLEISYRVSFAGEWIEVEAGDVRSAPRLPLEGIE